MPSLSHNNGIGDRLKWLRENGPLAEFRTVKKMCEQLNLKNSTWYDWLSDHYPPKGPLIDWLAHKGVNINWLESGIGAIYTQHSPELELLDDYDNQTEAKLLNILGKLSGNQNTEKIPYVSWGDGESAVVEKTGEMLEFNDDELVAVMVNESAMDGPRAGSLRLGDTVLVRPGGKPSQNEIWIIKYKIDKTQWSEWIVRKCALINSSSVVLEPYHPSFENLELKLEDIKFLARVEVHIAYTALND